MDTKETPVGEMDLPYGRSVSMKTLEYDGGMQLLRLTFREKRRFTTIDLDAETADRLSEILKGWSKDAW